MLRAEPKASARKIKFVRGSIQVMMVPLFVCIVHIEKKATFNL